MHESMVRDETWGFLDGGIRVERAQHTLALLRATLTSERPPVIDGQVTEAVLEASESIITHRRRTTSGRGPGLAAALGHVAAAARRRQPAVGRLPGRPARRGPPAGRRRRPRGAVRRRWRPSLAALDLDELCAGDRAGLGDALDTVGRTLRDLSDELGARYFGRKPPSRVLLGQWGGVTRMSRQGPEDFTPRRYEVRHRTTYTYEGADVTACYERGFLGPRPTPTQRVVSNEVRDLPRARPRQRAHRPLRQPVVATSRCAPRTACSR